LDSSDRLIEIAAAIADGTPVPWEFASHGVESATDRDALAGLRCVADIADAVRNATQAGPTTPDTLTEWGSLTIIECVGEGQFGRVYRAWDKRLDREVALKILHTERHGTDGVTDAVEEGRLLAKVRHPNVVAVYGAERVNGQVGIWMEFVHGRTLEDDLVESGPLPPERVAAIGRELAGALCAIHRAGVIHRDIKTQNVMIDRDGRLLLTDFGAGCERLESEHDRRAQTVGTPLYVAPEVVDGANANPSSDIYSLGVLLYHVATGSYPASGQTAGEIVDQRRQRPAAIVQVRPDFPAALAAIIERAMAVDAGHRYQKADELLAELARVVERPSNRSTVAGFIKNHTAATAGVLAMLVAVVVSLAALRPLRAQHEAPIIAVMPLNYVDSDQDAEEFADGVTSEIIQQLGTIRGLTVRSQTSSFYFKRRSRNLQEVANQLGVNLVIEGALQRLDTGVRVNIELVRAATDEVLWTGRFERDLREAFALQDDISRAVVNELQLQASPGPRRYEMNSDVYDEYLRARAVLEHKDPANLNRVRELFQYVIHRDSTFAPAYAGLAVAEADLAIRPGGRDVTDPAYQRAKQAALKARELDPLLPDAHAAIGIVQARDRQWTDAVASFERAISLNPNVSWIRLWYANWVLMQMGKLHQALEQLNLALRNDPLSLDVRRVRAMVEVMAGRYDDAIQDCRYVMAKDPTFPFVKAYLIRALWFSGRTTEAIELARGTSTQLSGFLLAATGQRDAAAAFARRATDNAMAQALTYVGLERFDDAFSALERMTKDSSPTVGSTLLLPELEPLKSDPRFSALRQRLGLSGT
jgi:serine/threonine protein kinase/tetratricopeptide (TPR) repeat protein